jgi:6-phosphogluconolactonase
MRAVLPSLAQQDPLIVTGGPMSSNGRTPDHSELLSRRDLLKSAAAVVVASATPAVAKPGTVLAYVGSYTPQGRGIYLFQAAPSSGALTLVKVFPSTINPSWLALDPTKRFLYAADEISNFNGSTTGAVSAYSINPSNGDLTPLNTVSSGGAGPAHLSVDPFGEHVLVANYGGGNVAVLPILIDGSLGNATDVKDDISACSPNVCPVGPALAQQGPPGSFAISGHDAPHAHMIQTDPAGRFVLVNDLGLDLTIVWQFQRSTGQLLNPVTVSSSPGAGPRHFAFHPNGSWFYSLNEEASTIAFMIYSASTGTLRPVQEIPTLPAGFVGTSFTSEVSVSSDGKFVYAANRLHDTIAIFGVGGSGELTLVGEEWTRGDYPRHFAIEPNGNFMYVCNHRADHITAFGIDAGGAKLKFTGRYTAVGSPAVIVFLTI